jgi:hypothetical protein
MRRGRIITSIIAAAALAVVGFAVAPGALAATPQDICQDLRDGKVDGSYTAAEWTAFFQDSTVQGYCSPVVIVTPPPVTTTTTSSTTPPTTTVTTTVTTQTPPATTTPVTPATPATPVTPGAPAVPLTPTSGVQGVQATVAAPAATTQGVQGANHTVKTPVARAAGTSPLATTKTTGALPFTGSQLGVFALVGLALLAAGLLLRSTGRSNER